MFKGPLKLDTTTTTISQNKYSLGEIWQKHLVKEKKKIANKENKLLVSSFDGFSPKKEKTNCERPKYKGYEWSCSKRHIRPSPPAAMD